MKEINLTFVACSAILALGLVGAGAVMGLLMRGPRVVLGNGAVYHKDSNNASTTENVFGIEAKNRSGDILRKKED